MVLLCFILEKEALMKKILLGLIALGVTCVYADQMVNLQHDKIMCGNYRISEKSTVNELNKHCKPYDTDHDMENGQKELELNFYSTAPHQDMKCIFLDGKLNYCKIDD